MSEILINRYILSVINLKSFFPHKKRTLYLFMIHIKLMKNYLTIRVKDEI